MQVAEGALDPHRLGADQPHREVRVVDQQVRGDPAADARDVRRVPLGDDVQRLLQQRHRGEDAGVVPLEQAAHQRHAQPPGLPHQVLRVGEGVGQRLLHQQRQPALQHPGADLAVRPVAGGHHHGVDVRHVVEVTDPAGAVPVRGGAADPLVRVDDGHQPGAVVAGNHPGVQGAHGPCAHEGDAQWRADRDDALLTSRGKVLDANVPAPVVIRAGRPGRRARGGGMGNAIQEPPPSLRAAWGWWCSRVRG